MSYHEDFTDVSLVTPEPSMDNLYAAAGTGAGTTDATQDTLYYDDPNAAANYYYNNNNNIDPTTTTTTSSSTEATDRTVPVASAADYYAAYSGNDGVDGGGGGNGVDDDFLYTDSSDPTVAATPVHLSSYAIPNQESLANGSENPLPMGLLVAPAVVLQPPPAQIERAPHKCTKCGAFLNIYSPLVPNQQSNSSWRCNFCGRHNTPAAATAAAATTTTTVNTADLYDYQQYPELTRKVVEYVEVGTSPRINAVPYVFVLDAHTPREALSQLVDSLEQVLSSLPDESYVGLVVFSNTVSVYHITHTGMAVAHTIDGSVSPGDLDFDYLFDRHSPPKQQQQQQQNGHGGGREELNARVAPVLGPVRECQGTLVECIRALRDGARTEQDAREKLLNPRCIGPAVETATALARLLHTGDDDDDADDNNNNNGGDAPHEENGGDPSARHNSRRRRRVPGGHVVLCTTGPPDVGPGGINALRSEEEQMPEATMYFETLGRLCHQSFITVNVFCGGMTNFAVPHLRRLADGTGGTVTLYGSFTSNFAADMSHRLFMACGYSGVLSIRTSACLGVSRIIGGVTELLAHRVGETTVSTTVQLSSVYPHEALAIYFNVTEDTADDYVYAQIILAYNDMQHNRITRSISVRIRTTGNMDTYLHSVDANVIGVLIAKRSVLMATHTDTFTLQEVYDDLDDQVIEIGKQLGREVIHEEAVAYELIDELRNLPRMMYLLRRGPMLGTILQHEDDITAVRALFLKCNLVDSLRLIAPTLLSFDAQGQFEQLPLEVLALQSGRILMLDHHTHIFIWSGRYVCGPEYDAYRDACVQRARDMSASRVPAPEILMFKEGSSQARWLVCRLVPSHKDRIELQLAAFPQLALLSDAQRDELMSKFLPTDEPSFYEYFNNLVTQW